MRKISAFSFISLDGYLNGPGNDISWHVHGREENQFAIDRMKAGNILLFGRRTYEMMAAYWPTPLVLEKFQKTYPVNGSVPIAEPGRTPNGCE